MRFYANRNNESLPLRILATPTDGMKDLIDDGINGYLSADDEVLAEKVLKIVNDPAHRAYLSENIKKKFAQVNDAPGYKRTIAQCYR